MSYLRKVFTKKQIVALIISGGVLILFFIIMAIGYRLSRTQDAQLGADRWDSKGNHSQISVFFSDMAFATEDTVKELNFNISTGLDKDSIAASNENARRTVYGFSSVGVLKVKYEKTSFDVKAFGVGGDFFLFHPVKLLSGSYFDGGDVMQDKVIIDNDTAWQLFGSYNIVGKMIEVNDKPHMIAGVYEMDTGRLNDLAGNNEKTIFVSYETLFNVLGDAPVNCFEILMPNAVSGYGMKIVKDAIEFIDESRYIIVENTGRFNWTKTLKRLKAVGSRSMNGKSILYPYWENMARGLEDILTPFVYIDLLLFLYVAVNIIILIVRMWKNREIHFTDVKNYLERRVEIYRERQKKLKKPEGGEYL